LVQMLTVWHYHIVYYETYEDFTWSGQRVAEHNPLLGYGRE